MSLLQYASAEGDRRHVSLADPLPVSAAPVTSRKVGEGKFFLAGSGKRTLSLAGNFRATLENPAGSGKTLYVVRLSAFATATGWARLFVNPTTGLPTAAPRYELNAVLGHPNPAVAVLRADTDTTVALGGGTDTEIDLAVPANERVEVDMPPLVVAAGNVVGINVPFAGAADSTMNVYWYEE